MEVQNLAGWISETNEALLDEAIGFQGNSTIISSSLVGPFGDEVVGLERAEYPLESLPSRSRPCN